MNMNLYGHRVGSGRVGLYGKELSSITAGEAEQNSLCLPALRATTSRRLFFQRPYRRRPPYCLFTFAWRLCGRAKRWCSYLQLIGRKVAIINLDPANDSLPYDCAINIEDLIKLSDVMNEHNLGPNGGLVYCMDYLEKNIDWLESKLKPLLKDHYFLFDFPGQVELFFLHSNAKNVIMQLIKKLDLRLTAVHLIDAHLCSDPGKYVSALLLSLSTMLHMELPHVNVLSKIDLIENYGKLAFNLDFYMDVQDLSYLQHHLDQDPRSSKYRKLTKELCEVIEDFGLVNFTTLAIQDKESVTNLVKLIDKTNDFFLKLHGYFNGVLNSNFTTAAVQEKYMKDDDNFDSDD
ncbi:unnamed protein product [Lactuca saligna]|uniref:GPN-loop GTPase 2 n=1 Tax=Lactuca saligna TaxID=75948 RepID=A0AA35YZ50_LACSI|nr:unnamed protein product [Lactuca saligna]